MRISELVSHWERDAKGRMSHTTYSIPLDVESAARLAALAEMYPKRSTEALLGELVGAALEAVDAVRDAPLQRLVVAGFEVQAIELVLTTPVATKQGV